jgi:hypothetical protein
VKKPTGRVVPLADYDGAMKVELASMPVQARTALAAAAAERLFAPYAAVVDSAGRTDGGIVRRALDAAWEAAATGLGDGDAASGLFERCIELISDLADIPGSEYADDAIAAAAYAAQSGAGLDPQAAGWASQRVLDAIDSYLLATVVHPDDQEADLKVWQHELTQREIARRERDRADLAAPADFAEAVRTIRTRAAESEAIPVDRLHVTFPDAD